jgi:hypothetical protein
MAFYDISHLIGKKYSHLTIIKDMGKAPSKHHSVDRIDNTKNYCKENCRWATSSEQSNNRTNCIFIKHNNKVKTLINWARELNLNYAQLNYLVTKYDIPFQMAIKIVTNPFVEKKRQEKL